jgi:major vault protein
MRDKDKKLIIDKHG